MLRLLYIDGILIAKSDLIRFAANENLGLNHCLSYFLCEQTR